MGPLLYWRRVPCSAGSIVGASIAGMALSHAIARGVLAGLFTRAGVFQITAKGGQAAAARAWAAAVREEMLLLAALLVAIVAVALTRKAGHAESLLWMLMLALQALPYLAALACAAAASWSPRRRWVARQTSAPAAPTVAVAPAVSVAPAVAIASTALSPGLARLDAKTGGGR